jgi:hypothetical protein
MLKKRPWCKYLVLAMGCGISFFSNAAEISETDACALLKKAAYQYHFANESVPRGHYYCDAESSSGEFYIFGLHYSYQAPPGREVSNLVGWYAVHRSDGKVFEWEMSDMKLGKPVTSRRKVGGSGGADNDQAR